MDQEIARMWEACLRDGDVGRWTDLARTLDRAGDAPGAAAAWDRVYGLAPENPQVREARAAVLDGLALVEHGFTWRYVPGGVFLMGSETGDPDERPVREVDLPAFWIMDQPVTWADFCRHLQWEEPTGSGMPSGDWLQEQGIDSFALYYQCTKQRWFYCRDPAPSQESWRSEEGRWDTKPMTSTCWQDAEALAEVLGGTVQEGDPPVTYRLPSEAEWEKAARGGLVGRRYANGESAPPAEGYDWASFREPGLLVPRTLPANGYGLHGMCGGVWEWTADWYDALAYRGAVPQEKPPAERVLRGGSWADDPEVCTVSFRMSSASCDWRVASPAQTSPTYGFRLVREVVDKPDLR